MKKNTWNILCIVMAAASVVACVVAFAAGGCESMLQLESGGQVPMKCHWTMRAAGLLEIGAIVAAILGFTTPGVHGRRVCAALVALQNVLLLVAFYTPVMGLCGGAAMQCNQNALVAAVCAVVAIVVAVVGCVRCDPTPAKPKKEF